MDQLPPRRWKGESDAPRVRTTINPVKRGIKRLTRNPIGNPRERVAMGSESERALNRRNERTSPLLLGLTGLPKKGQDIRGLRLCSRPASTPQQTRRKARP